jgi:hypothetical protein
MASSENIELLVGLLAPLYDKAPGGISKIRTFLATESGVKSATDMLAAIGLVTVGADGGLTAVAAATGSGGAVADANSRCQDPLVEVPFTVSGSLKSALKKQIEAVAAATAEGQVLKEGQGCVRKNCKTTYDPASPQDQTCTYCPGEPVFHEGYKYWSCCDKRKTIDFDEFLAYKGCSSSDACKWFKDAEEGVEEKKPCRYDWYETAGDVVVEVLAKVPTPEKTSIKVNGDTLLVETVYERTNKFVLKINLAGKIDTSVCKITLFSTKINIKLKKLGGGKWESVGEEAPEE